MRRLLCNALIQPHYDYACSAWYPSLSKRLLKKIQISQNKCIRYCLKLDNRSHVGFDELKKLNWLPTKERVFQCICVNIFKFFNDMSPEYTSEIFHPFHRRHNTRASTLMLDLPFRKSCSGQKTLSYLGPKTWNTLPAEIKLRKNVNTFKHDIKQLFFKNFKRIPMTYLFTTSQQLNTCNLYITHGVLVSICLSYSPRDHNENKVYH